MTEPQFATTLWTLVVQAGASETKDSRAALEQLCRSYWHPIYAQVRRHGWSAEDAQDLTQSFFLHLLEHCRFDQLTPSKGRFRSYLLSALNHYLADVWDRQRARKRGDGQALMPLDDTAAEAQYASERQPPSTPEKEFDRRWALAVLDRALNALAQEQAAEGKADFFDKVRVFLIDAAEHGDYAGVAAELGKSPNTLAVSVRRLRQRYRELVRAEVAQTLANVGDLEREMGFLLEAIRP